MGEEDAGVVGLGEGDVEVGEEANLVRHLKFNLSYKYMNLKPISKAIGCYPTSRR